MYHISKINVNDFNHLFFWFICLFEYLFISLFICVPKTDSFVQAPSLLACPSEQGYVISLGCMCVYKKKKLASNLKYGFSSNFGLFQTNSPGAGKNSSGFV